VGIQNDYWTVLAFEMLMGISDLAGNRFIATFRCGGGLTRRHRQKVDHARHIRIAAHAA
jgi:hypothetical protein